MCGGSSSDRSGDLCVSVRSVGGRRCVVSAPVTGLVTSVLSSLCVCQECRWEELCGVSSSDRSGDLCVSVRSVGGRRCAASAPVTGLVTSVCLSGVSVGGGVWRQLQ